MKSVSEVIKSNNENKKNNNKRDVRESFEKKFALLLQEHNNYLSRLIKSKNKLYDLNYILNRTGYESRAIIRGNIKFIRLKNDKFYFSEDNLMIKLNFFEKPDGMVLLNPDSEQIKKQNLKEHPKLNNIYASRDYVYSYIEHLDAMSEIPHLSYLLEKEKIKHEIEQKLNKNIEIVRELIYRNNDISKNILSPYMRIIYHLLKISKENATNDKDRKNHTNIIRSVVPYDILMLVAINAMYFYKIPNEKNNEIQRWSDLFNDTHDSIFNDYHKYYQLLIESDFFEHLIMNFSEVIFKLKNTNLNANLLLISTTTMLCESNYGRRSKKYYLLFCGDIEYYKPLIYKEINNATLKLETDILVLLFFKKDRRIDMEKRRIMTNLILKDSSTMKKGRIKNTTLDILLSTSPVAYKKERMISLPRNFYEEYTEGKLINVIENENKN